MKHADVLLKEILKEPVADAPRLVLADHFEQEGEIDRANLIRVQIRRANLPAWEAEVVDLDLAERALLAKHETKWRRALPKLDGVRWGPFTRGFVGEVWFDSTVALDEQLPACAKVAPIESVSTRWPRTAKFKQLGAVDNLRALTIVGTLMRPGDLKWLASCPLLSTVRSLSLIESNLRQGIVHLLKSKHLGALETLRIPMHHIGNSGISKLVANAPPKLVALDLSCSDEDEDGGGYGSGSGRRIAASPIRSKGVLELQAWPGLARIRSLDLSNAKLGSEGLLMLLASVNSKGLETLRIRAIKDGDWDMDDSLGAFKSGPAGMLRELDISDNDLDPDAAHYMAEARSLRELAVLRMDNLRSTAFDRLAKASWVKSLRVLSCGEQPLPSILKRVPEQLHTLQISASSAPLSKVVQHLAADPPPALRVLDLTRARIDDEGLRRLGKLDLGKLVSIALPRARAGFSLAAMKELAESPLGTRVTSLDLGVKELDRLPSPTAFDPDDVVDDVEDNDVF